MKRIPLLLPITFSLIFSLTACTAQPTAEEQLSQLRSAYQSMEGITAVGSLRADYTDRVYDFEVRIEGSDKAGSITVTAPENLSGTQILWADNALSLDTEGVVLETGALSPDGFSPADAVPAILKTCRAGTVLECRNEGKEGAFLYALLQNPEAEDCTVACIFDAESGGLGRAVIAEQGRSVITLELSEFHITSSEGA